MSLREREDLKLTRVFLLFFSADKKQFDLLLVKHGERGRWAWPGILRWHTVRSGCVQGFKQKFLPCSNPSFFLPPFHTSQFFSLLIPFWDRVCHCPGWLQTHCVPEAELNSGSPYLHLPSVGATGFNHHTKFSLPFYSLCRSFFPCDDRSQWHPCLWEGWSPPTKQRS